MVSKTVDLPEGQHDLRGEANELENGDSKVGSFWKRRPCNHNSVVCLLGYLRFVGETTKCRPTATPSQACGQLMSRFIKGYKRLLPSNTFSAAQLSDKEATYNPRETRPCSNLRRKRCKICPTVNGERRPTQCCLFGSTRQHQSTLVRAEIVWHR